MANSDEGGTGAQSSSPISTPKWANGVRKIVRRERPVHLLRDLYRVAVELVTRGEPTGFVNPVVVGKESFRYHAQDTFGGYRGRHAVEVVLDTQGKSN